MDWFGDDIWLTWVTLGVIVGLIELISGDLIFLMLGIAAFAAAGTAALGGGEIWQLATFAVVSVALLSLVRPRIVAKIHDGPTLPSGRSGMVGTLAIVEEQVTRHAGRVRIGDEYWSARPVDSEASYDPGEELLIAGIEGATLRVVRKEN